MSETEYDPSGKSNSSFQVGAETLNLLLSHSVHNCISLNSIVLLF